jgi:hypothetical protein
VPCGLRRERAGRVRYSYQAAKDSSLQKWRNAKWALTHHAQLTHRRIVVRFFFLILLSMLTVAPTSSASDQKRALTKNDLLQLIAGGVYSRRVAALVQERGLAFSPTKSDLKLLRRAGADEFLLKIVAKTQVRPPGDTVSQVKQAPSQKKSDFHRQPVASLLTPVTRANSQILEILSSAKITLRNWQQYRHYMPLGMIRLFEGKYFWKMPADIEIDRLSRRVNIQPTPVRRLAVF